MSWEKYRGNDGRTRTTGALVILTNSSVFLEAVITPNMTITNNTPTPLDPWISFTSIVTFNSVPSSYDINIYAYSSSDNGATWLLVWSVGGNEATNRTSVRVNIFRPYVYTAMSGTVVSPPNGPKVPANGTATLRMRILLAVTDPNVAVGAPLSSGNVPCSATLGFAWSIITS